MKLFSESPQQDYHYGLNDVVDIQSAVRYTSRMNLDFLRAYLYLRFTGDFYPLDVLPYQDCLRNLHADDVELSIGGDIYCYDDYPKFIRLHELINQKGCKSILLGCSLEERLFEDPVFLEDLRKYTYISARDSITYGYLEKVGLNNIGYAPDTAFILKSENLPLPAGFIEKNTVGLNLSPMASEKEKIPGIVIKNYRTLIQSILDRTDCAVALIPHVIWQGNDDRTVLMHLYEEFKVSGRIVMIPDYNCTQLKGYISRCRFFIGARTHATIAAYSTCVPTLSVGYSNKASGIAVDLFGSDEHFVLPVQTFRGESDLSNAFWWLWSHERQVAEHLKKTIPGYTSHVYNIKSIIEQRIGSII